MFIEKQKLNENFLNDSSLDSIDKIKMGIAKDLIDQYKVFSIILGFLGIVGAIAGIISYFILPDYSFVAYMLLIIAVFFIFGCIIRVLSIKSKRFSLINAACVSKSRCGYRKQYFEYDFITNNKNEECFTIKTAQKQSFKRGFSYNMLFKVPDVITENIYSTMNLLTSQKVGVISEENISSGEANEEACSKAEDIEDNG